MHRILPFAALIVMGFAPLPFPRPAQKGWVSLFDGKTLKGWATHPNQPGKWTVEDGAITCTGWTSHLYTESGGYTDFRVRVEVKINARGNSGLYFRAARGVLEPDGWEAQVALDGDLKTKTGSIYPNRVFEDLRDPAARSSVVVAKHLHEPDEWFTLEVEAVGPKLTTWVNGKKATEWTDPKARYLRGHFAIQHHNPNTSVKIRKIEVMELPRK